MNKFNFEYSFSTLTLRDVLKINPDVLENLVMSTQDRTSKLQNMFKAYYNSKSIAGETIELFKLWIEDTFNVYKDYYEDILNEYEKEINLDDGKVISRQINDNGSITEEGSSTDNSTRTDDSTTGVTGTYSEEGNSSDNSTRTDDSTTGVTGNFSETGSKTDTFNKTDTTNNDTNTDHIDLPNTSTSGEYVSYRDKTENDVSLVQTGTIGTATSGSGSNSNTTDYDNESTIEATNEYSKSNNTTNTTKYDNESSIDNSNEYDKTKTHTNTTIETIKGDVNVVEQRNLALNYIRNIYMEFVKKFEDCFSHIYA